MTKEQKISAFCARNGLYYEWEELRYNGRRAKITSLDRIHHAAMLAAARRLKGVSVDEWTCSAGGVWEGYIFLQDAADHVRIRSLCAAETERVENWWIALHRAMESGLSHADAQAEAERQYPTPCIA